MANQTLGFGDRQSSVFRTNNKSLPLIFIIFISCKEPVMHKVQTACNVKCNTRIPMSESHLNTLPETILDRD